MNYKIDAKAIRQAMTGRWGEILPLIDSKLAPAIKAAGQHVPCPRGTGHSDGFRIPLEGHIDGHAFHNQLSNDALSDGFKLLMWSNDWSFYQALAAVSSALNDSGVNQAIKNTAKIKHKDYTKKRKLFKRWLDESSETPHDAAVKYFINRGLYRAPLVRSGSLRYIGAIPFLYDGALIRNLDGSIFTTPAILCGMRTDSAVTGFNIIRIDEEGNKADKVIAKALELERGGFDGNISAKQLLSIRPMVGSCCRFGAVGEVWNVGEGVETMLAVAGALETSSVAATGTAALLESLKVPDHVERLNIWADKDVSGRGQESASKLMNRFIRNKEVFVFTPEGNIPNKQKGLDWLDRSGDIARISNTGE